MTTTKTTPRLRGVDAVTPHQADALIECPCVRPAEGLANADDRVYLSNEAQGIEEMKKLFNTHS